MLHASTQKLILKLCDLTERGEAPWREGEGDASWFETEGYRIEVRPEPPAVRVLQAGGREVESADAVQLSSAAYPSEPGKTYADRVRSMALEARRIARGAEKAISTILSALSNPPAAEPEPPHFSSAGGAESEAAMAAAVADMAMRLKQQPLEEAASPPSPAPLPVDVSDGSSGSAAATLKAAPSPSPGLGRTAFTQAMFGAIPSFSTAVPRGLALQTTASSPSAPAPAAPLHKVTSSGLVVTGFHAVTVQTPETSHMPDRKPPSSAGYRPWT